MFNQKNLLSKEKATKQNRIWVRIASACNHECIFCLDSNAQDGTFPEEDLIKAQIRDGFKDGYENRVIISGGEASINPKFPKYIQYAKELGYDRVQTITNGTMFAREDFCKKVFDAWLEEVTFSIHGHTKELHDYLTNTPWSFEKAIRGLLFIKKYYPNIIINIDIVVNKINIRFLPKIVTFFMRLDVYEFDILQIIPFGRGFHENREVLFYNIGDNLLPLHQTWKLSKIPGVHMWTNRFPAEAFEGFEDLIQDPRKIKWEVMGESAYIFEPFFQSEWSVKPECYGDTCNYCFQKQYCHDFINNSTKKKVSHLDEFFILSWEEFPSQVYEKYWDTGQHFISHLKSINKPILNLPKCLGWTGIYQTYNDFKESNTVEDYTKHYIQDLNRKKSTRCTGCIYNDSCEGIHINYIRSYGFEILQPIID